MLKMANPLLPLIVPNPIDWPENTPANAHTRLQADSYQQAFENAQGHIAHIHQLLTEKDQTITDLTAQVQSLTHVLDRIVPIVDDLNQKTILSHPTSSSKVKVATPDTFDGDRTKFKSWWRSICILISSYS
jgi:hypothetical protein